MKVYWYSGGEARKVPPIMINSTLSMGCPILENILRRNSTCLVGSYSHDRARNTAGDSGV